MTLHIIWKLPVNTSSRDYVLFNHIDFSRRIDFSNIVEHSKWNRATTVCSQSMIRENIRLTSTILVSSLLVAFLDQGAISP